MRAAIVAMSLAAALPFAGCAISPDPLEHTAIRDAAQASFVEIDRGQEPFSQPVNLNEAMARAIKYNLELQLEMAQTSLRLAELDVAHFSLLPNAVANAGYAARNNHQASSSLNLVTNQPNFGASTSQDRQQKTADLTFSWNILDFGLSYVRAHQSADRVLIGEELQRKVLHKLLEDVRSAYWRAVTYEKLIERFAVLEKRAQVAIASSRSLSRQRDTSVILALTSERELIEIKRTLKELQRDLAFAKTQLGVLMNVKPGTPFRLASGSAAGNAPPIPFDRQQAIEHSLEHRPELRENLYQQRINGAEARAALLELLPGIQLYDGPQRDSNSYLLHHNWIAWGAKASWNLLKVFQYPARRNAIEQQDEVLRVRALALTMAVLAQVEMSRVRFDHFVGELDANGEQRSVQQRLVQQIRSEMQAGRVSETVLLREEMSLLLAEARRDLAYANVESAYANMLASIGGEPYGPIDRSMSLAALAASLRTGQAAQQPDETRVTFAAPSAGGPVKIR